MRKHSLCIFSLIFISISQLAIASSDIEDIEALINLYGKETIIHFIMKKRGNHITVSDKGQFIDFNGSPDRNYVTPETIANDFEIMGISPSNFEEMENRSRLHKEKSSAIAVDEEKTEDVQVASTDLPLYKATFAPVTLRSSPNFQSPEIGEIPEGAVVEAIDEALHWIKVKVEGKKGWAPLALRVIEAEREVILDCSLYGTKGVKNGMYRSFISVRNVGDKDFDGTLTLYAYNENEIVFYGFQHFEIGPIPAGGGRTVFIETKDRVTRIETKYP